MYCNAHLILLLLGDSCEIDKDGCADTPCSPIQNCFDLTPSEEQTYGRGFNCSACPDGYDDIEGICVGNISLFYTERT